MPSFDVKAFRSRRQPVIVAFPNVRRAKRRSGTHPETLASPEMAAGVMDVSGAMGGSPLLHPTGDPALASAVVVDLVTGTTISGASSGQDMAASETWEPKSVSGGALLAGPAQTDGPGSPITMLDDAAAVGPDLMIPCPAQHEAFATQPPAPARVPLADVAAVLTERVMLADGVVIAFGSILPGGEMCSDRWLE